MSASPAAIAPANVPSASPTSPAWLPIALVAATCAALAPALGGGWLEYDDDWLIRDNPVLGAGSLAAVPTILFDLSRATRLALGAEYLPVRDLVVWLLFGVLGAPVWALHVAQIALYATGALLVRRWLRLALGATATSELGAWLFALHPVHVEAAAWLASLKDVLMLVLAAAALVCWASERPRDRTIAIVLAVLACFAKGAGVVVPLLFVATDVAMARRTDRARFGAALGLCGLAAVLHAHVGSVVGMFAEPIGGSRISTAASMLVVTWRYLGLATGLGAHSIIYEVDALEPGDPRALGAGLGLALVCVLVATASRRGLRWPLFALLVFAIPLLPVSQVLAPLQNRMADRYLLLAALGPCVAISEAAGAMGRRAGGRIPAILAAGLVACAALLTLVRAMTFASPIALFAEATERTTQNTVAPYQLAMALEAEGRDADAEAAYRRTMERDGMTTEHGRRAGNNLGRLLFRSGRLVEAAALYRQLRATYPDDPRVLSNLATVLERLGELEEARRLRAELAERFPDYRRGAR